MPFINAFQFGENVACWTHADVGDWLDDSGLGEYKKSFAKKVDGLGLLLMTTSDLAQLGIQV